jgi:maleylacetate reductase
MEDFVHTQPPARVVFGPGRLDSTPAECAALGMTRVLVIAGGAATGPGDRVETLLGDTAAGRIAQVAQHVPEQLADEACRTADEVNADGLCCVGGGSATGLAKAMARTSRWPIVAIPTTYAGSEATPIYGVTGERKRTGTDDHVRPRTVIYDPELTVGLPRAATAASGFNALAHAIAALTGGSADPLARLQAREAIRLIRSALPVATSRPDDLGARGELLWAAWLSGSALAVAGTGPHHRLCHALGGRFGLVHADTHAVLLPHTVALDPGLDLAALDGALDDDPPHTLRELASEVGAPQRLPLDHMDSNQLAEVVRVASEATPDPVWIRELLEIVTKPTGGES